jgi:hypothetical protein
MLSNYSFETSGGTPTFCLWPGLCQFTGEGQVLYKTEHNRLGRFPQVASEDLQAGPKRNFHLFDPLDFWRR